MIRALWDSGDVYVIRWTARRMWDDLPGPVWVKCLLMAVTVALLVTPGPDELIIPAGAAYFRRRAARA